MTTRTGVGCGVVIAVVTGRTIIGNGSVSPVQCIEIIVNAESRRCPGCRTVTGSTICWQIQHQVSRIGRTDIVRVVACSTFFGRTLKTIGVALQTVGVQMRTGERKTGGVVVKYIVGTASRVAGQTSCIIIRVATHSAVLVVRFRIGMTADTGVFGIVCRIGMTVGTLTPFALMFSAVYRKMLRIMVKCGRFPC